MKKVMELKQIKTLSDEQLVEIIQRKEDPNDVGFSELVSRHQMTLLKRCISTIGNRVDAEDIVQEVLMRAYRYLASFKGNALFKTWLISILDNQCKNYFAGRNFEYADTDDWVALADQHMEEEDAFVIAEQAEPVEQVSQVLGSMPDFAKDVLMLRFHLELPIAVISHTLGISLSATKMRLYRALALFEQQFKCSVVT